MGKHIRLPERPLSNYQVKDISAVGTWKITPYITNSIGRISCCQPLSLFHTWMIGRQWQSPVPHALLNPKSLLFFKKHNQIAEPVLCRISGPESLALPLKIWFLNYNRTVIIRGTLCLYTHGQSLPKNEGHSFKRKKYAEEGAHFSNGSMLK